MSPYLIVSLGNQDREPTNLAQGVCVQTGSVASLYLVNAGRDVLPRPYCSDTRGGASGEQILPPSSRPTQVRTTPKLSFRALIEPGGESVREMVL